MTTKPEETDEDKAAVEGEEAFASGFKEAGEEGGARPRGEADKVVADPKKKGGSEATGEGEGNELGAEKKADEVVPPAEPKYVQLTEDDFKLLKAGVDKTIQLEAKVADQFSKAFGTIGSLKQAIDKITNSKGEIDEKELEQLETDFPELGAQMKKILRRTKAEGTDPAKTAENVEATLTAMVQRQRLIDLETEVEDEHPKWRDTVGAYGADNPFRKWLATRDQKYQDRLNTTNSARVIISALDEFKGAQAKPAAPTNGGTSTAAPQIRRQNGVQARRDRFASAVTPQGVGSTPPKAKTEQDHFNEGFVNG